MQSERNEPKSRNKIPSAQAFFLWYCRSLFTIVKANTQAGQKSSSRSRPPCRVRDASRPLIFAFAVLEPCPQRLNACQAHSPPFFFMFALGPALYEGQLGPPSRSQNLLCVHEEQSDTPPKSFFAIAENPSWSQSTPVSTKICQLKSCSRWSETHLSTRNPIQSCQQVHKIIQTYSKYQNT